MLNIYSLRNFSLIDQINLLLLQHIKTTLYFLVRKLATYEWLLLFL
nr:MAG TPA: hypothetical protein [Caudoviricetes sp.]